MKYFTLKECISSNTAKEKVKTKGNRSFLPFLLEVVKPHAAFGWIKRTIF